MNLLSLVELDDSFEIYGAHEAAIAGKPCSYKDRAIPVGARLARDEARQIAANALANRFPRAPAAKSNTP